MRAPGPPAAAELVAPPIVTPDAGGGVVVVPDEVVVLDGRPSRRRRRPPRRARSTAPSGRVRPSARTRRIALVVGALAAVAVALGYQVLQLDRATDGLRSTERRLGSQRAAVARTEDRLAAARTDLAAAREVLGGLEARLARTSGRLGARTTERDRLLESLERLTDDLRGTEASLSAASVQLVGQVHLVADLRTCLDGVTRALTLVTFDDPDAALANLDTVAGPCGRAGSSGVLPSVGR